MQKFPFNLTYRELWIPRTIRSTIMPAFRGDAHPCTLVNGAIKATTADGVRFYGTATSNILVANNAGQNNQVAFHITIRFKLLQTFAAGAAANQYLFQKLLVNEWIRAYLNAADGKLYWEQGDGAGGNQFQLTSTTVSWTANTWYIITCSLADTPAQRLLVNGIAEDTDIAAARNTPNGGDIIIGSSSDGGVDGVVGVISWVVIGVGAIAIALTSAEETDLSKGYPPLAAKIQHLYLLDEGRGTVSTDRGTLVVNGTLDSACTWEYGQCQAVALSLNGKANVGAYAVSSSGVKINGELSLIYVAKMKSTYSSLSLNKRFIISDIGDNSHYITLFYDFNLNTIRFVYRPGVAAVITETTAKPSIDDYWIIICTVLSGYISLHINGSLAGTPVAIPTSSLMTASPTTMYIGSGFPVGGYNVDKPIFTALIEGGLNAKNTLIYSRWLKDILNLPISI